ncbi:CotO family spore coat protein [Neobacillus pocheonensis]|uniref:CotO family spore coat protein n=1 Tax=Neobacillus pocheonensis TaxID=363869 RepID=UPI003D2AACFA
MSKKRSQEPLLFINQSNSKTPLNNNMQEIYTNRQEKELPKEEIPKEEPKMKAKKDAIHQPIQKDIPKTEVASHQENKQPSFSRVKPFKEMDIKERLEYLINFPKVLPPAPCVLYTVDKSYQGYLKEYADNQVTIQLPNQSIKTVAFEDIKNVVMIGIKR